MKLSLCLLAFIGQVQGFAPPRITRVHKIKPIANPAASSVGTSTNGPYTSSSTQLQALPFLTEDNTQKLILLTLEKAIEAGVPALFFVLSAWWIVGLVKGDDDGKLYLIGHC